MEYAAVLSMVVLLSITSIQSLGGALRTTFTSVGSAIEQTPQAEAPSSSVVSTSTNTNTNNQAVNGNLTSGISLTSGINTGSSSGTSVSVSIPSSGLLSGSSISGTLGGLNFGN